MIRYYIRTFKYVPILLIFTAVIGITYTQKRILLWNTYSFTINIIFFFAAWISIGFFDSEDTIQQQLSFLRSNSKISYYLSKIISIWIISVFFNIVIVFTPILFNMFKPPVFWYEVAFALIIHIFISLLGISVSAFFQTRILPDRRTALAGLFLLLLVSSLQVIMVKSFAFLKYITWLLPPVSFVSEKMLSLGGTSIYFMMSSISSCIIYILLYSMLLMGLYFKIILRKMF